MIPLGLRVTREQKTKKKRAFFLIFQDYKMYKKVQQLHFVLYSIASSCPYRKRQATHSARPGMHTKPDIDRHPPLLLCSSTKSLGPGPIILLLLLRRGLPCKVRLSFN
jgi:hypothetical protein